MKKYCDRCKKYHNSDPVDPKKIIEKLSKDIARNIDQEVIESLKPTIYVHDPITREIKKYLPSNEYSPAIENTITFGNREQ